MFPKKLVPASNPNVNLTGQSEMLRHLGGVMLVHDCGRSGGRPRLSLVAWGIRESNDMDPSPFGFPWIAIRFSLMEAKLKIRL